MGEIISVFLLSAGAIAAFCASEVVRELEWRSDHAIDQMRE